MFVTTTRRTFPTCRANSYLAHARFFQGSIDKARAFAAQPVAMVEIHWSCPYGKPLSKYS